MITQTKLLKPFLYFVSIVFKIFVLLRIFLYRIGWLKTYTLKTPVLSVGNLTIGGTGKTPIVDFLAKDFQNKNLNPAILSRGYRRKSPYTIRRLRFCEDIKIDPSFFGDEPYLLALQNPKVPVFVGNSRVKIAKLAEKKDNPDVIILDDAYQHIKLHRNLNLLLIDTETGFGNNNLIPLGVLREPVKHWKRADAIILTKSNLSSSKNILTILNHDLEVTCPIFNFNYKAKGLCRLDGKSKIEIKEIKNKRILAISGIAQPKAFLRSIEKCEGKIISKIDFSDHHSYLKKDITKIRTKQQKFNPDLIITTEKDAIKLRKFTEIVEDFWVLEMEIEAEKSWYDFFDDFLNSNFGRSNTRKN